MSEKDVTSKEYLENDDRIADLINVAYHNGRQIVLPEHVHECKRISAIKQGKDNKRKTTEITRDIVNKVEVQMKSTIIAIEAQSDIHYAMPLRVLAGDFAMYQEQWIKIKAEHKEAKDTKGAEYLSGFTKEDKLIPASTIVLYLGQKPWDGPRCLKDMLDLEGLPEAMKEHIADYPLYIIDVRRFLEYEKFKTDLRIVFGFLQRDESDQELYEYLNENKEAFSNMAEEAYDLIAQFSGSWKKLKDYKTDTYMKDGELDMCKAIDDLMAKSEKRGYDSGYDNGYDSGQDIGIILGIVTTYKDLGQTKENALQSLITKKKLNKEKAEEYVNLYW